MRLIDADAMHKFVEEKVAEGKDGWANGVGYEWAWALTAVDMQPTIDAVPVVRCFDCIHRVYKDMGFDIGEVGGCALYGCAMPGDSFCSFGQKRKDGAE